MKKLCAFLIILSLMPGLIISATPPMPPQDILVILTDQNGVHIQEPLLGHLDILVLKEDAGSRLLDSVSLSFIEKFGDPLLYDYLSLDGEYVSYLAYVLDASFGVESPSTYSFFTAYHEEHRTFSSFKLIYIDEHKNTQAISQVIEIKDLSDDEYIDGYIEFNIETGTIGFYIEVIKKPNWGRFFIFVMLYAVIVIAIRTYFYYIISISIILIIVVIVRIYLKKRL